jgi:hypothetical protein
MIALGGWIRPLWALSSPVRLAAVVMPSRWAFEGLLLLEADQHPPPPEAEGTEPGGDHDVAEDLFPAETDRMGPRADAMALGCLLLGLAAAATFIAARAKPAR